MKIKSIYSLLLLIIITLLSACATNQMKSPNTTGQQAYQEQIQYSGRISVQYQQDEQEQNLHGNFEWQQKDSTISISLTSPLGQTIANITQSPQGASITEANQETRYADNLEQLLNETVGWTLPVNELKVWLQGFQLNQAQQIQAIPHTDNQVISTQGWTLRYVNWQQSESLIIPKRIDLTRNTSQLGELKIRIVIDEWKNAL